ncbi:MAG: adenosine deaminase family protein [Oligoflexia bacterium]|nr:adenosine deaminase family protein [Oligoflexia bacterium]
MYAELHRHLQGSLPRRFLEQRLVELPLQELVSRMPMRLRERYRSCPNVQTFERSGKLSELLVYREFKDFAAAYVTSLFLLDSPQALKSGLQALVEDLLTDKISYVELIVAPREYEMLGINLEQLATILSEASQDSLGKHGLRMEWILEPVRNLGCAAGQELLKMVKNICPNLFCGITLGGDELNYPAHDFKALFDDARDMGLHLTAHAGETDGAQSIWDAIQILQVERIGHGVRAAEDDRLIDYLAAKSIPLELCLSANIALGIYPSFLQHPLKELVQRGVRVSINTDDPTFFKTSLHQEYQILRSLLGPTTSETIIKGSWSQKFANYPTS